MSAALLLLVALAVPEEWPQFLGPARNGSTSERGVVETWKESGRFRESIDMAIFKAVDAGTGETPWRDRGFGTGSIVVAGDRLVVLSDSGELALLQPDRAALEVLRRQQVLTGKTWTPSVASGKILLRNHELLVGLET